MAIYDLYEDECTDIQRSTISDPKIHGLTGIGEGCQYFSTGELESKGIWIQDVYDVPGGFKDSNGVLIKKLMEKFVSRQHDYQWKVTTYRKLVLLPGDFIRFHPKWELPEDLSVISYEENSDHELVLELGARQPTNSDVWEAYQDISYGYTAGYLQESHIDIQATAADFYILDPTHFTAPLGELTFAVPAEVLDATLLPRATLDLTIDFKTETVLKAGCCAVELKTDEVYRQYGNFIGWTPGSEIKQIDVTSWLTAGASNVITIGVYMANEYTVAHSAYTEHPVLTANGTMKFWKRKELA